MQPKHACVDALLESLEAILQKMENPPRILRDEPMRRHTTFRVGGPADLFVEPSSAEQVAEVVRACRMRGVTPLVLGNGSNLLVRDGGIRGLVMHIGANMARCTVAGNRLTAQAGALLSTAARTAAQAGLDGLVFAEGIPGSVGGGACMNAGAYGGEMVQVVERVQIVDALGEIRTVDAAAMDYGYRHSALMDTGWIATQVDFALAPGDPQQIAEHMRDLSERRHAKQPLHLPSAGSTFKRPRGHFAAQLIDEAGLKGESIGGAQVSPKHAGFVVGSADATAADILALIERVRERVLAHSGVLLEPEVKIVGVD